MPFKILAHGGHVSSKFVIDASPFLVGRAMSMLSSFHMYKHFAKQRNIFHILP